MKARRRRNKTTVTAIPDDLDLSPSEAGSRLVRELGTEEGFRAFLELCDERNLWGHDNGVAMDPHDFHVTGLPTKFRSFRAGFRHVLPRNQY